MLVKNWMSKALVVVDPSTSVIKAQILLKDHDISHLPVMDEEKLLGIITKGDLFRVLVPLTGVGKKGIQFALLLEDRRGAIKEITDIIRANGGRMMSVLTSYDRAPKGSLKLYLRMYGLERKKLKTLKDKIREKASLLYMVDHRENTREVYVNDSCSASG
jgi:acetoin utilization protein AcuB